MLALALALTDDVVAVGKSTDMTDVVTGGKGTAD